MTKFDLSTERGERLAQLFAENTSKEILCLKIVDLEDMEARLE